MSSLPERLVLNIEEMVVSKIRHKPPYVRSAKSILCFYLLLAWCLWRCFSVLTPTLPSLSVLFWVPGRVGWGRPSNCPCWGLRWWFWRRGRLSPGTMFSTCGRTPSMISAGSEPRSSTESFARVPWITLVSHTDPVAENQRLHYRNPLICRS